MDLKFKFTSDSGVQANPSSSVCIKSPGKKAAIMGRDKARFKIQPSTNDNIELLADLPWMTKSKVISDDGPEVTGSHGINSSQLLSLNDSLTQFIGHQLNQSRYPWPPSILKY